MVSSLQFHPALASHRYAGQNATRSVRFGDDDIKTETTDKSDAKDKQESQETNKQGFWSYISSLVHSLFEKLNLGELVGKLRLCINEWFAQFGKTEETKTEEVKAEVKTEEAQQKNTEIKQEDTKPQTDQDNKDSNQA